MLDESKKYPRKDNLVSHFAAASNGSWDNISWSKGDVGHMSGAIKDRHGFTSVYVRFKGQKTARLIPEKLCKKWFKTTSEDKIDPEKWANREKGGTSVKYNKRSKRQFKKADIVSKLKKHIKEVKDMSTENQSVEQLDEAVSVKTPFFIMKVGEGAAGKWAVCKWKGSGSPQLHKKQGNYSVVQSVTDQKHAATIRDSKNGVKANPEDKENKMGSEKKEVAGKQQMKESIDAALEAAEAGSPSEFAERIEAELAERINQAIEARKVEICQTIGKEAE